MRVPLLIANRTDSTFAYSLPMRTAQKLVTATVSDTLSDVEPLSRLVG